jgi:hypothetical protein
LDGPNAGRSATANTTGEYRFENLTTGNANMAAAAEGFAEDRRGVTLSGAIVLNFTLTRSGPRRQFGAGQYRVGTDIAAGRYYGDPTDGCYWERQSGFSGSLNDVIANEFVAFNAGQWIVDIIGSDRGFETDAECGTWFSTPRHGQQSNIQPGMWLVGSQIPAGTYRTDARSGCYWERLRNFEGTLNAIIDNEFVAGDASQIVTISSGDTGFHADADCGTWTRLQNILTNNSENPSGSVGDIERNRTMNRNQEGSSRRLR